MLKNMACDMGFWCVAGWIGKDVVTGVIGNGANKVLSSSDSVWTIPSFCLAKIAHECTLHIHSGHK